MADVNHLLHHILDRAVAAICALPVIPGVTVHLDETGDFPELIITSSRRLTEAEISACHHAAGELGAGIKFRIPSALGVRESEPPSRLGRGWPGADGSSLTDPDLHRPEPSLLPQGLVGASARADGGFINTTTGGARP